MRIDDVLFKIKKLLPKSLVLWLRKPLIFLKKFHPKLSKEEVKKILTERLGVTKGSVVFIHSSVDKMYLNFSYFELYQMLLELVGTEGTLLFPSSHIKIRVEDFLKQNPEFVFDVKKTPSIRGMLSEIARRDKNSIRSLHPTNAVVAVGKYAKELTSEQHLDIYPCGKLSPFYKIVNYNAIIIGLGVDTEYLTFVHAVEDVMAENFPLRTRDNTIFSCNVRTENKEIITVKTLVAHKRIRFRSVPKFIKREISKNICDDFKVKGVRFFKADAKKLFIKMQELAQKKNTIYFPKAYQ